MTPKWRVKVSSTAKRQLSELDQTVAARVRKFVHERLVSSPDPRRLGLKLVGADDIWRFRIGDYRLLATVDDGQVIIVLLTVAHRSVVYRKLPKRGDMEF